jgi:hypothetical protein
MLWGEERLLPLPPFPCTSTECRQLVEAGQQIDGHGGGIVAIGVRIGRHLAALGSPPPVVEGAGELVPRTAAP